MTVNMKLNNAFLDLSGNESVMRAFKYVMRVPPDHFRSSFDFSDN